MALARFLISSLVWQAGMVVLGWAVEKQNNSVVKL